MKDFCKLHSVAEVCKDDDLSQFELCDSDGCLVPPQRPLSWDSAAETTATFTALSSTFGPAELFVFFFFFTLDVLLLSGNELLSLQSKTGRNKSAAVQFVKKDWGKCGGINASLTVCTGYLPRAR